MSGCVLVYVCVIIACVSAAVVLSHYRRGGASVLSASSVTSPPPPRPLELRTRTPPRCPVVSCTHTHTPRLLLSSRHGRT